MKVLVADDSITVRKIAERQLTAAGFEVALAASGEEAMAWLAHGRPDLIVSDVIMPDKSGYDVCAFVRSHASLAATPVVLISGIVNEEVTQRAEACRANAVLKKPFQGSSLQQQVTALLAAGVPATVPNGDGTATETVAKPVSPPAPAEPGPQSKAYRISEEQLRAFKKTMARVAELEQLLADERAYAAALLKRLVEVEQVAERATQLGQDLQRLVQDLRRQPGPEGSGR